MRISAKIMLLVLAVGVSYIITLLLHNSHEREEARSFIKDRLHKEKVHFGYTQKLKSDSLKLFAVDYAFRDDMVAFVETGSTAWAKQNLDTALPTYQADFLWVYRPDHSLVYSFNNKTPSLLREIPIPLPDRKKLFRNEKIKYFFVKTRHGLVEIYGSTMHPAADPQRKTQPQGYLFVGRLWGRQYLKELSRETESAVKLRLAPFPKAVTQDKGAKNDIRFTKIHRNWEGRPAAEIHVSEDFPLIERFQAELNRTLIFSAISLVLLLSLAALLLRRWVTAPLTVLSKSIRTGHPSLLQRLNRQAPEIKRLAELTSVFFKQQQSLQHRFNLEKIITDISTFFINIGPEELDVSIQQALETIGVFTEVDRSYLFLFNRQKTKITYAYEWCAPDIESQMGQMKELEASDFPWWTEKLLASETIHIPNIDALPKEANNEKAFLQESGIKSLLVIPMIYKGFLEGLVGFDSVRQERVWNTDDITLLQIVGEIFANALAHKRDKETLEKLNHQHKLILDSINEGIYELSADGKAIFINPAVSRMTGFSEDELIGRHLHRIIHHTKIDGTPYPREECPTCSSYREETPIRVSDEIFWRKDGSFFPVEYVCTPIKKNNALTGAVVVFQDITERKEQDRKIQHLAYYDSLTDLPNRRLLEDRLEQALAHAKREEKLLAVMYFDIDNFKIINETLGYEKGDLILRKVAELLQSWLRREDTVSRQGGDEFTIVVPHLTKQQDASRIARKIITMLSKPMETNGHLVHIAASIGISIFPFHGEDLQSLLNNADTALYRAKERGKNNYQFYNSSLKARNWERLIMENSLSQALEQKELTVYYQPQVELSTGRIIAVEALIRWNHPELGLIKPGAFISIAEDTGLIIPLGEQMLRTACAQIKQWQSESLPLIKLALNLSARQFQQKNLIERIRATAKETGLELRYLEIEITESIAMEKAEQTLKMLRDLRSLGVSLAIDDFGAGFSSLSYLKRFPVEKLKIDISFIKDLEDSPEDEAIAKAVIALAHGLNLEVIAEGVETEAQLAFLKAEGCDGVQGFYFAKPMPAEEFKKMLAAQRRLELPESA